MSTIPVSRRNTIYADYQATTPVDPRVVEHMSPYWRESFGNPHSSDHVVGWGAAEAVRESQTSVAGLIGGDPDEIVFTSGATEANNLALFGLARRAPEGRRQILVSAIEHKCVLAAARALAEREGFVVEVITVDDEGFIDLNALENMLNDNVLVVSVMAVNNEVGTIQDIPRISGMLAGSGILFHCDAAQAPTAMDVSELAIHADLISLSGHKAYGPQGIGALYIRRNVQESVEPIIYGGGQQNGLRSGTVPVPLCAGMAAAVDILRTDEGAEERDRVAGQRDAFVGLLQNSGFPAVINGSTGGRRHPETPTCSLMDLSLRTFWDRSSLGLRLQPGPPALRVSRNRLMSCAPWDSTPNRPSLPLGSALDGLRPMRKSRKLRIC